MGINFQSHHPLCIPQISQTKQWWSLPEEEPGSRTWTSCWCQGLKALQESRWLWEPDKRRLPSVELRNSVDLGDIEKNPTTTTAKKPRKKKEGKETETDKNTLSHPLWEGNSTGQYSDFYFPGYFCVKCCLMYFSQSVMQTTSFCHVSHCLVHILKRK